MLLTIIVFLLILTVLVLIHEAGHYFVAKKFGIKVEEFGFGFPLTPALWQKKKGETIYSFYPVLIGGFVKLYGEDDAGGGKLSSKEQAVKKEDEHRAFYSRSLAQRISVVVAGVIMNTILAVVIYYVFLFMGNFHTQLPLIGTHRFFGVDQSVTTQVVISEVEKNSPADKAGLTPFSTIQSVNGKPIPELNTFAKVVKENAGLPITIVWQDEKTQKNHTAIVIPRLHPPKNQGALGVAFYPVKTVNLSYDTPMQKLFSGFVHPANLMAYNFDALGYLIHVSVQEKNFAPVSEGVSGPVGIGYVVGSIIQIPNANERIMQLLNLIGLLSISLAFFNVLPIPGLDGGRLLFLVIEAISHKKVNPKVEGYIHAVGMAFLLVLLLLVTVKDINQFFLH
ncbi:MAG TPA: M50 family metallopeptidase [Candidatus Saccharimonadales bacterium]|nr:M50 family metallopeptidase [Candidatus Saccharimonadales bacterium]